LQQPNQAEVWLTACQGRRPDFDVWVFILRGYASGQLGERAQRSQQTDQAALHFAAAAADFRQAQTLLERQPNGEAAYNLRVNRAATLILQEKYADARQDLLDAKERKPKQFNAYLLLAETYADQKNHDAALVHLNQAIALQPQLAVLYHKRGQVQRDLQNL